MKTYEQLKEETQVLSEGVATDFEAYITVAYNGGLKSSKNQGILKAANKSEEQYSQHKAAAEKISSVLRKKFGAKTQMIHYGSGAGKMVDWWNGKNTPKTDNYIGKNRFSLKEAGGSQLLSASRAEALSTFTAALKYMESDSTEAQKLVNKVKKTMTEVIVPKKTTIGDLTKAVKDGKSFRGAMKQLADKYTNTTKAHKKLTKDVNAFFNDNQEFRKWFTYEAATGEMKFSPEPIAAANWVLKFDTSGEVHQLERLSMGNSKPSKYVVKLSEKVKYRISWKTPTSKGQKTYSSFRGDILKENYTVYDMIQEEVDLFEENILEEGLLDSVKKKSSEFLAKVKAFFLKLYNRIVSYMQSLVDSGVKAILDFLEIEPKSISVSGLEY